MGEFRSALLLCSLLLTACSGSSEFASPVQTSSTGTASQMIDVSPDAQHYHKSNQRCLTGGGSWTIPPVKYSKRFGSLEGSVNYGQNSCIQKQDVAIVSVLGQSFSCRDGLTAAKFYVSFDAKAPLTFNGSGQTLTVNSSLLDDSTSYTALLLAVSGNVSLYQQNVGKPVNGTLTFASPSQNALQWPAAKNDTLVLIFCS